MLTDKIVLASVVVGLALLSGIGWAFFGGPGDAKGSGPRYTHMHCPACEDEIPYSTGLAGKTCEACTARATYQPTVGSIHDRGQAGRGLGKVVTFVLLAALLVQGLAYLCVVRFRALRRAEEEEHNRKLICHCPFCQRKIRYPAAKAGTGVLCAQCKTAFTLASVEEAEVEANA